MVCLLWQCKGWGNQRTAPGTIAVSRGLSDLDAGWEHPVENLIHQFGHLHSHPQELGVRTPASPLLRMIFKTPAAS